MLITPSKEVILMIQNPGLTRVPAESTSSSSGWKQIAYYYASSSTTIGLSSSPLYLNIQEDAQWEDVTEVKIIIVASLSLSVGPMSIRFGDSSGLSMSIGATSIIGATHTLYTSVSVPINASMRIGPYGDTMYMITNSSYSSTTQTYFGNTSLSGSILGSGKVYSTSTYTISMSSNGMISVLVR